MTEMTLKSELTRKDYSKLMTFDLLKKPTTIFIFVIGLGLISFHFKDPESGNFYLILGLAFVGLPVLTYFTIGKAYDKNKNFNEKLEFTIDQNNLKLSGQTFHSTYNWTQVTKVKESADHFIIYQGQV